MSTPENIKRIRKEKGLTQKELGELCGMADSAIRRYESGRANPKIETLKKIAIALDVSVSDLRDDFFDFKDKVISDSAALRAAQKHGSGDWLFKGLLKKYLIEELDMTDDKYQLLFEYNKLNQTGQEEALKRISELTEIPRYTEPDDSDTPE